MTASTMGDDTTAYVTCSISLSARLISTPSANLKIMWEKHFWDWLKKNKKKIFKNWH